MPEGYNLTEIATSLGRTPSWVSERLNELRSELLLQTGLFFPLTDQEYEALHDSIERHGIQSPIILGEHIPLVDGRHRLLIAEELGLDDVPSIWLQGLDPEQERELAIALNAARRQLNRTQRRKIVEAELMRNPTRSDRWIASIAGVSHPTVAAIRAEIVHHQRLERESTMESSSTEPLTEKVLEGAGAEAMRDTTMRPRVEADPAERIGRDGVAQPVPARPATPAPEEAERPLGYVTCSHGQRHAIYRDGSGYRIEGV